MTVSTISREDAQTQKTMQVTFSPRPLVPAPVQPPRFTDLPDELQVDILRHIPIKGRVYKEKPTLIARFTTCTLSPEISTTAIISSFLPGRPGHYSNTN